MIADSVTLLYIIVCRKVLRGKTWRKRKHAAHIFHSHDQVTEERENLEAKIQVVPGSVRVKTGVSDCAAHARGVASDVFSN